ncbi:hypothetical protein HK102_001075, partial [Quaeritorhiza haematococci]
MKATIEPKDDVWEQRQPSFDRQQQQPSFLTSVAAKRPPLHADMLYSTRSTLRPPAGCHIPSPPPAPSSIPEKLSHALPLPFHLVRSGFYSASSILSAACAHLIDGPVRPGWNFATSLLHAGLKSVLISHPPQGRHALGIIRFATSFSYPVVFSGCRAEEAEVRIEMSERLREVVVNEFAQVPERQGQQRQRGREVGSEVQCKPRILKGEWIIHKDAEPDMDESPLIYYLHGGAHIFMSPQTHRGITTKISQVCKSPVFALDYRLCPEHPLPAAIEDALATYIALIGLDTSHLSSSRGEKFGFSASIERPSSTRSVPSLPVSNRKVFIMGDSSGGCLTVQLLQAINKLGLPKPAGVVLLSPFVNHECNSDSFRRNWDSDYMTMDYAGMQWALSVYSGGLPMSHPVVSPIFGDLSDLPPMLIQAGDAEVLTDDAVQLFSRAIQQGTYAELQLFAGMFHVFQALPTVAARDEAFSRIAEFVKKVYGAPERMFRLRSSSVSSSVVQESAQMAAVAAPAEGGEGREGQQREEGSAPPPYMGEVALRIFVDGYDSPRQEEIPVSTISHFASSFR